MRLNSRLCASLAFDAAVATVTMGVLRINTVGESSTQHMLSKLQDEV